MLGPVVVLLSTFASAVVTPDAPVPDTDHDNVPDDVERGLGSDPRDAHDVPAIPEPLYFDLVRNLGSQKGELEVNVLGASAFTLEHGLRWSAEAEVAPVDGLALELETSFEGTRPDAVKGGAMVTVGSLALRRLELGVLGLHERAVHEKRSSTIVAAVTGVRFSHRVQGVTIVGPSLWTRGGAVRLGAELHPSVFYQATRGTTLGLELGYRFEAGRPATVTALPQLHLTPGSHVRVQVGLGTESVVRGHLRALGVVRLSYEL